MTIEEIIQLSGLSKAEFCRRYKIPHRTLYNWIEGSRECPEYLLQLLEYRVELIKWANNNGIQLPEEKKEGKKMYIRVDDNNNTTEVSRINWRKDLKDTGARTLLYLDADTKERVLKCENYFGRLQIIEDNRGYDNE